MYNINKGGNTLDESEILEPVHACLRELIDRDNRGLSHNIRYSDDDIIAITLLYTLILGNRLLHTLTEEKVSIGMSQEIAEGYRQSIRHLTKSMTRVDTSAYYKDKQ